MKKVILIVVLMFVLMESLGLLVYKKTKDEKNNQSAQQVATNKSNVNVQEGVKTEQNSSPSKQNVNESFNSSSEQNLLNQKIGSFPYVAVEKQGDLTVRTIHIGVRQWAWDPAILTAKYGEKVVLIIHNADVEHSISIPQLGVNSKIPEEGVIVTFMANSRGTFDYFCDTPCGNGHNKMKGRITIS